MANSNRLVYKDYRPIQKGDKGWSPEKQKNRWMYSPSEHKAISRRQFVTGAYGGVRWEKISEQRQKQGIPKKQYRQREIVPKLKPGKKPGKKRLPPPSEQPVKIVKPVKKQKGKKKKEKRGVRDTAYIERVLFLKEKFAERFSLDYGVQLEWDELTDFDKTLFWDKYHDLVDRNNAPTEETYIDEDFEDYFGDFDNGFYDIEYGETP